MRWELLTVKWDQHLRWRSFPIWHNAFQFLPLADVDCLSNMSISVTYQYARQRNSEQNSASWCWTENKDWIDTHNKTQFLTFDVRSSQRVQMWVLVITEAIAEWQAWSSRCWAASCSTIQSDHIYLFWCYAVRVVCIFCYTYLEPEVLDAVTDIPWSLTFRFAAVWGFIYCLLKRFLSCRRWCRPALQWIRWPKLLFQRSSKHNIQFVHRGGSPPPPPPPPPPPSCLPLPSFITVCSGMTVDTLNTTRYCAVTAWNAATQLCWLHLFMIKVSWRSNVFPWSNSQPAFLPGLPSWDIGKDKCYTKTHKNKAHDGRKHVFRTLAWLQIDFGCIGIYPSGN